LRQLDRVAVTLVVTALAFLAVGGGVRLALVATAEEGTPKEESVEGAIDDIPQPEIVQDQVRSEGVLALHKIRLILGELVCGNECTEVYLPPSVLAEQLTDRCVRLGVGQLEQTGFFDGERAVELETLSAACSEFAETAGVAHSEDAVLDHLQAAKNALASVPAFAEPK